jgi:hypothetical protein
MALGSPSQDVCAVCKRNLAERADESGGLCADCRARSEELFEAEMSRIELIRTLRGYDVELYDVKHPDCRVERNHCGQVTVIHAGGGFEVKVCLRTEALDWMERLRDPADGFTSPDNRLDALIGNIYLLLESWGSGAYYIDIFHVDRVVSTEGEV